MLVDLLLFVSKRLQPVVAALICLAFAQLVLAGGAAPQTPPGVWRVAITR